METYQNKCFKISTHSELLKLQVTHCKVEETHYDSVRLDAGQHYLKDACSGHSSETPALGERDF